MFKAHVRPRSSWKTTDLIKQCHKTKWIALVNNCHSRKYMKGLSEKMWMIIDIATYWEYKQWLVPEDRHIYIDELSHFIKYLFPSSNWIVSYWTYWCDKRWINDMEYWCLTS